MAYEGCRDMAGDENQLAEVDLFEWLKAMECRTSGERYLHFSPEFEVFRKGYELCLELIHHIGGTAPTNDRDRVLRDLACDTLDSLRVAQIALLCGYDNQTVVLLRRCYETTSLMAYFIQFHEEAEAWHNGKRIAPSVVREALDKAPLREPKDILAHMYKIYSLFSHPNRTTVSHRLLGEDNRFTIGAQGNVKEETVAGFVRELLHQMVWFADVMAYAFVHVAKGLGDDYRQSSLEYRGEVAKFFERLPSVL
jgi:hypothetical protein